MKVRDLIRRLECFDPEANVILATQESWPFENQLLGAVERLDIVDHDEEGALVPPSGASMSDVLLVEGRQLRYGSKEAWNAVRS